MNHLMKIIPFIAAFCGALLSLDRLYEFGLKNNLNIKLSAIGQHPAGADILFHGPCEPLWMLSPGMLKPVVQRSAYNLALSNSDFADNYLQLYLYLKFDTPPRAMYLYVTPASFDPETNTFNAFRFAPYLEDSIVSRVVMENDPAYFRWTFIPFMKYAYYNSEVTFNVIQGYKHYFTGRTQGYYPDGYEPPAEHAIGTSSDSYTAVLRDTIHYQWSEAREKYLLKIIQLARSKGIRVYLYESPILKESLLLEKNRQLQLRRIETLAQSENVPFIRFDSLPMASDPSNFNAPRNLNRKGVKLFNAVFGAYLKQEASTW